MQQEESFVYKLIKKSMFARRTLHNMVSNIQAALLSGYKDPEILNLIAKVRKENELWVTTAEAALIHSFAKAQRRVPGDMAEVGVYKGATARMICDAKGDATLHLFDTFAGLPNPKKEDGGFFEEGMFTGLLPEVQEYLSSCSTIHFHPGLFPETGKAVQDKKFSFVYLDVDMYQSTKDSLDFFYPRMNSRGIIMSHDYQFPGIKKAFVDAGLQDQVIELVDSLCMVIID